MLLVVDRVAYDNKDEVLKPVLEKLCTVDCLPQKKDGFVSYVSNFAKVDKTTSEKVWELIVACKEKQRKSKLDYTDTIVSVFSHSKEQKNLGKEKKPKKEKKEVKKLIKNDTSKLEKQVKHLIALKKEVITVLLAHRQSIKDRDELKKAVVKGISERNPLCSSAEIEKMFDTSVCVFFVRLMHRWSKVRSTNIL